MGEVVLEFGTPTSDLEGRMGQVTLAVVAPQSRTVTHVVVMPDDVATTARLVAIENVVAADQESVRLGCWRAQFMALPAAVSYQFASNTTSLDGAAWTLSGAGRDGAAPPDGSTAASYQMLPNGAIGLGHGQSVRGSDAAIGHLVGVGVELGDHRLTSVVVAEGHLLSKRNVSFPIEVIMELAGEVRLNLTRQQAESAARPY